MMYTEHTLLVGEGAEEFEEMLGIVTPLPATTTQTVEVYESWKEANCQPNFYRNLIGADERCGPYTPVSDKDTTLLSGLEEVRLQWVDQDNHDTIGMVSLNAEGHMACGTTTNGANHKVIFMQTANVSVVAFSVLL